MAVAVVDTDMHRMQCKKNNLLRKRTAVHTGTVVMDTAVTVAVVAADVVAVAKVNALVCVLKLHRQMRLQIFPVDVRS